MKTEILGVKIDNMTMEKAILKTFNEFFEQSGTMKIIVTPNPEFVMRAQKDEKFKNLINNADLSIPDGIGIVYASKLTNNKMNERVAGYDFTKNILEKASDTGHKIFILGAKPGVAKKAANNIKKQFPGVNIVGTHHGYFKSEEDEKIIKIINQARPDYLILGLGVPRQEFFMEKYKDKIKAKVAIGNGGSIDVFAGNVKRAPKIYQKLGLEWFYRLVKQPSRFGRMLNIPKFMFKVIVTKIKTGRL